MDGAITSYKLEENCVLGEESAHVYEHLIYNARVAKLMASFQVALGWICSGVGSPIEDLAQLF